MVVENIADMGKIGRVKFVFEDSSDYSIFDNITQSYGLCFNSLGEICIVRSHAFFSNNWVLPGGTIEDGETPVDTLHREVMEEADITLKRFHLLGGQRCYLLDKPDEKVVSQLRYVALIGEIQAQTPDPDNGEFCERKFVKPEELNEYIQWGSVGDHLVISAKDWFDNL